MKTEQAIWNPKEGFDHQLPGDLGKSAQLVFLFGSAPVLGDGCLAGLRDAYPDAHLFGCSTAGEIRGTNVTDGSIVATAIHFDSAEVSGSKVAISDSADSYDAGRRLADALSRDGLVHVFVLSDGIHVNGSDLVAGLTEHLPGHVTVTGGLSGDGSRFQHTTVIWDADPAPKTVAAVGFYGERLKIGCGSKGGWDPFGPERLVTRSEGNVLYELDGRSALELYKEYLGDHARGLPATGLLFPLSVRTAGREYPVVRTILGVSEKDQSLTFAGDVPRGAYARFMKANIDRLVDGAAGAAKTSLEGNHADAPDLAVLISCVGRKLVLKQRVEEEVEGVRDALGDRTALTGFYSYGEICPFGPGARCELHNQTMTVTCFSEM